MSIITLPMSCDNVIIQSMEKRSEESKAYKRKYNIKYKADHYKRIPLDVTFDKYDEIKSAADRKGETVNGFIKTAIDTRLKGDN